MIVPTLEQFEELLADISTQVNIAIAAKLNNSHLKPEKDSCGHGSTVMYLDKRKSLYKFLTSIPFDLYRFYFVGIGDGLIRIGLRNLKTTHSYTLQKFAYDIVVERLQQAYGWEIYNNVDLD